jgi:acyl-homoserine-lactone acylase
MQFGMLGPLEATAESGGPVAPGDATARALLAVLLRRLVMRSPVTKTRALVAQVLGLAALAATVAACGDHDAAARGDGSRYSAEIRRTGYGIPHIVARDYGSLGYGYGYAFAQDNLCVMAERVLTLRGGRSRYFGPTADANDPLADERGISNLGSDVYYRDVRQSGVVRRLLARQAPLGPTTPLRRMVAGYVAGYNRYLRDTGVAHLPDPNCRGKAWVGPITALDVWSGVYDLNGFAGTAQFRDAIASARPPAAGAPARAAALAGHAERPMR